MNHPYRDIADKMPPPNMPWNMPWYAAYPLTTLFGIMVGLLIAGTTSKPTSSMNDVPKKNPCIPTAYVMPAATLGVHAHCEDSRQTIRMNRWGDETHVFCNCELYPSKD